MEWWLRGLVIGLSVAAPVGPMAMLCIRRTIAEGWRAGFVTGLGTATADACYATVAAFGLTALSGVLVRGQGALRLVGGLFLLYLGVRAVMQPPATEAAVVRGSGGLVRAYAATFALTLANPPTIFIFAALFASIGAGLSAGQGAASASALVLGVFLGSALWWLVLSSAIGFARGRLTPPRLRIVNIISGLVIAAFGAAALLSLLK